MALAMSFTLLAGFTRSLGEENLNDQFISAAASGDEARVKDFLARGMNVNALSSGRVGGTALMEAAQYGHTNVVKILLDHNIDVKSGYTQTALFWAAAKHHFEIASMLLAHGVDGRGALVQLSMQGDVTATEFLLSKSVAVNVEDDNGTTPLAAAASRGHTAVVKLLLNNKANVNYKSQKHGMTALMSAAQLDTLAALVEKGADVNAKSNQGWTALMGAAWDGHFEMVKFLISQHADANMRNSSGESAFDIAVKKGHTEISAFLQQAGGI